MRKDKRHITEFIVSQIQFAMEKYTKLQVIAHKNTDKPQTLT